MRGRCLLFYLAIHQVLMLALQVFQLAQFPFQLLFSRGIAQGLLMQVLLSLPACEVCG